jgi:hypothetical protein
MSGISLQKATERSEKVGKILLTKGVSVAPTMRCGLAIDISGSMGGYFARGTVQKSVDQLVGVSLKFDDNGELDMFKFNTGCDYVGTANVNNYDTFIADNRVSANGGTAYIPIVEEAVKFFFAGQKKSSGGFLGFGKKTEVVAGDDSPVLMMVLTDGEPNERVNDILRAFKDAAQHNIYFHLVGIGGDRRSFPTIARIADDLDNVGEVYLPTLDMTDDEIYAQIIGDELVQWIKTHGGSQRATA